MQKESAIHVICGPVGSGKSTFANELADRINGVVFAIDEWMAELFQPDISEVTTVANMNPAWFAERVDRCESMIYRVAEAVLRTGRPVVLDLGFIRRMRREKAYEFAKRLDTRPALHYVTESESVRRGRVESRNLQKGSTYAFHVTPEMFAFAEQMFEPPAVDEIERFSEI